MENCSFIVHPSACCCAIEISCADCEQFTFRRPTIGDVELHQGCKRACGGHCVNCAICTPGNAIKGIMTSFYKAFRGSKAVCVEIEGNQSGQLAKWSHLENSPGAK